MDVKGHMLSMALKTGNLQSKDVAEKRLDAVLGSGYGIFAGKKVQWATLVFSPEMARWISKEIWHENQKSKLLKDGSFELKIPYSNDTELLMDVLRYGSKVKVVAPKELVSRVTKEIASMAKSYDFS